MKALTTTQMQRLDRLTVKRYGVPVLLLMENAGRAVAETTREWLRKKRGRTALILTGSGHNGGDGIVAARYLGNWGYQVKVLWVKDPALLEGDAGTHYRIAQRFGVPFQPFLLSSRHAVSRDPSYRADLIGPGLRIAGATESRRNLQQADVLVDALLGTGLKGVVRDPYASAITAINASRRPIIAVDIPSGLDANTGKPLGMAVKASVTVTMAAPKIGLLLPSAKPFVGRLKVADIGIPKKLIQKFL